MIPTLADIRDLVLTVMAGVGVYLILVAVCAK